ncbi:MAG: hypothetical protein RIS20_1141 [Bacteroidota bacterium]|jgi:hypothetical protein
MKYTSIICMLSCVIAVLYACETSKKSKKTKKSAAKVETVYLLEVESPNEFHASLKTEVQKGQKIEGKELVTFDTLDTVGRTWEFKISVPGKFEFDTTFQIRNKKQFKKTFAYLFYKVPFQRPKNATYNYVNNEFKPIEAIEGNQLDTAMLTDALLKSIASEDAELKMDRIRFYKKPKYHLSDETTKQGLIALKKSLSAKITLQFKNENVVIDKKTFANWLILDSNMRVNLNSSKSIAFVRDLATKYDEIIPSVTITSSKGETKTIRGGDIGLRLNVYKELMKIIGSVRNAEEVSREPSYGMKGLPAGVFDSNKTYVEISIADQKLWYYKNGVLIIESAVVTGCPKLGHATPVGAYYVKYMETNAELKGPGYSAHVRYWMPFNNGIGLHDARWRNKFGNALYLADGSHGCINLPLATAQTIYQHITPGTIVLCY